MPAEILVSAGCIVPDWNRIRIQCHSITKILDFYDCVVVTNQSLFVILLRKIIVSEFFPIITTTLTFIADVFLSRLFFTSLFWLFIEHIIIRILIIRILTRRLWIRNLLSVIEIKILLVLICLVILVVLLIILLLECTILIKKRMRK